MNAYEWIIVTAFVISTPAVIWLAIRESRRHKHQNR